MDAPQYVHADVLSNVPFSRLFNYTHHSDMDAPKFEHTDVPSTCVPDCLIKHITVILTLYSMYTLMYVQTICVTECFITHYTAIWMLPSMYTLM